MRNNSGDVNQLINDSMGQSHETATQYKHSGSNHSNNSSWSEVNVICYYASNSFDTSATFHSIIYIMYSIVFCLSLFGNGMVCFVVHTTPRMKTVTNYFIVNLATGDIMMTLFCVPFSFVSMLILRYWPFGWFLCKMVNYTQAVSVLVSAYTLFAISIDRYIVIMHPLKPRLGKRSAKIVVSLVWLCASATAAPILIVTGLKRPTLWHQYCEADLCIEQWAYPQQSEHYTIALLFLQFLLPLSSLVVTYSRIACAVWGGRPPGEADPQRDTRLQNSKRRMVKMMLTVVFVFITCWLPLNIFILLWTTHGNNEEFVQWAGWPYVWFVCHWLAMSQCCYNPVIYCYMNNKYRNGFQRVITYFTPSRSEPSSRQRNSLGDALPMTDVLGVGRVSSRSTNNGCRQSRGVTPSSSCSSNRRVTAPRAHTPTPPIRALSVRPHFN